MDSSNMHNGYENLFKEIAYSENIKPIKISVNMLTKGGYLSDSSSITIIGETKDGNKKELYLFLKSIITDVNMRNEVSASDMYEREVIMYNTILAKLLEFQDNKKVPKPFSGVPKCYKTSTTNNYEFLIFEDLGAMGYTMWNKTEEMNRECFEKILKEFGKFHGLGFAYKDQNSNEFEKLARLIDHNLLKNFSKQEVMDQLMSSIIETLEDEPDIQYIEALNRLKKKGVRDLYLRAMDYDCKEKVVIHGDCWCNNFMLLFDDKADRSSVSSVKFLDWQLSQVNCPVIDLQFFIYSNGSKEVFDNLDYYLKIYHDSVTSMIMDCGSEPGKIFTFETLKEHWKLHSDFGLIEGLIIYQMCYGHAEEIPSFTLEDNEESLVDEVRKMLPVGINRIECKRRSKNLLSHYIKRGFI